MRQLVRGSLLVQMLGIYLVFVLVVLAAGAAVDAVVQQRLQSDVQASDQALAQEIAIDTSHTLGDAESSLRNLAAALYQRGAVSPGGSAALQSALLGFQISRPEIDRVYWLDQIGDVVMAAPELPPGASLELQPPGVVEPLLSPTFAKQAIQVGYAQSPPFGPGVIIAVPVPLNHGTNPLVGMLAVSLNLSELSEPLTSVVHPQGRQNLDISIIDHQGELVGTPLLITSDSQRFLYTVSDQLPGADQALKGRDTSRLAVGADGKDWLFSAVHVPGTEPDYWAVVVQRPASLALAVVTQLHLWLLAAALIFALGGLVFWLMLLGRVIRPLHALAVHHRTLPSEEQPPPPGMAELSERDDEVGGLARSLARLERDVRAQLGELRTLRLVDVQAAAVLVPDEHGVLRVLVGDGHSERYQQALSLSPEQASAAPVQALRDGRPVQKLPDNSEPLPGFAYEEGFRAVLAIPIISRHAGGVVLLVHRTAPQPFTENEVDLLLTFANYATLAWEHAVLYERSDERLREVASENERLYREATAEKQTLAAIMGSMSDGLVLTGVDGKILYANPGARAIAGIPSNELERSHVSTLFQALGEATEHLDGHEQALAALASGQRMQHVIEMVRGGRRHAIHLRLFDVTDEAGTTIGRGLLLRDVTHERELDEFKSALLAAVGHELRTPLAAIKGHASTLLQQDVTWSAEDQHHFLETISGEADRLAQLVSNLLDLSRLEEGLIPLNRAPVRLDELAAHAMQRLSHPGQPRAEVKVEIPADLPALDVDGARIEVVLQNLLANAVAYGGGEVHLAAIRRGEEVVVSVADNGPGIAADELPHVFERFYRARLGQQQRSGGTGLGLAICKAFVEAHGGAIWAESGGEGTTISFSLPLAAPVVAVTT
jgi:PAS domain S-box-containing protein